MQTGFALKLYHSVLLWSWLSSWASLCLDFLHSLKDTQFIRFLWELSDLCSSSLLWNTVNSIDVSTFSCNGLADIILAVDILLEGFFLSIYFSCFVTDNISNALYKISLNWRRGEFHSVNILRALSEPPWYNLSVSWRCLLVNKSVSEWQMYHEPITVGFGSVSPTSP